jgi:phosphate acetyltransferase
MMAPSFNSLESGFEFPPISQSYAQPAIDRYALASLDMNPVHTNAEWAQRAQVFGMPDTVGHGMMTMSTMASVVTRPWGVVSSNGGSIRFVESKFTKPVRVGEMITATGKVKQKHICGPNKNWVLVAVEARDSTGALVGVSEIGYNLPD